MLYIIEIDSCEGEAMTANCRNFAKMLSTDDVVVVRRHSPIAIGECPARFFFRSSIFSYMFYVVVDYIKLRYVHREQKSIC